MSDFTGIYASMMAEGTEFFKKMSEASPMKDFDQFVPTLPKEWMEAMFGTALGGAGLDAKTRLLVTLSGLVASGAHGAEQMRLTIRHAVEAGASKEEISQTIYQAAVFSGPPALGRALDAAAVVLADDEDAQA
ncbi:MAG: hypothetical protein CR993_02095 [Rhodobacterales bacterium]|nr:MAG: hypothetical protein CR993_02095 [Rhodobacterales bacterium]